MKFLTLGTCAEDFSPGIQVNGTPARQRRHIMQKSLYVGHSFWRYGGKLLGKFDGLSGLCAYIRSIIAKFLDDGHRILSSDFIKSLHVT